MFVHEASIQLNFKASP